MKPCDKCWGSGRAIDHARLGAAARKRRQRGKLTLKAMARRLGVAESQLSLLEHGKRKWSRALYEKATQ